MIFGFNTDIKSGNTVYHVQSEARQHERLLQTQLFVRGQCIGKKAASYAELVGHSDFSEERMHEMLKAQHRATVESLRAGNVDEALSQIRPLAEMLAEMTGKPLPAAPADQPPPTGELSLEFLNSGEVFAGETLQLRFRVSVQGKAAHGAKIVSRVTELSDDGQEHRPVFSRSETAPDGCGELQLPIHLESATNAVVLVQATHEGKSAMKKFRVTK